MIGYRYAVLGVLIVNHSVLSQDMNCTSVTMACPSAAQWTERGKQFNCTGKRRYICLLASNSELREGCMFNSPIPPGRIGCPNIKQCDVLTGQPLLVTEQNYLLCPPDLNGCPPYNHSGYSILEIYKYPACQRRNISAESAFSPDEVTHTSTTILFAGIHRYENWTTNIICITIGTILAVITIVIVVFRKKIEGFLKKKDGNTENVVNIAPKPTTVHSNTQNDVSCTQDCTRKETKESTKIRTFIVRLSNNKNFPTIPLNSVEAQAPIQHQKHDTTEQISQIPSVGARITMGPQNIVQESFEEIDVNTENVENIAPKTRTVYSNTQNDVSYIQDCTRKKTSTRKRTFIARLPNDKELSNSVEAQAPVQKHDTTEQTLETSSAEARITTEPQDISQEDWEETDSDTDNVVDVDDIGITTTDVTSYPGKDVSEPIQSISRLETKDPITTRMIHNTQSFISGTGSVPPAVQPNQQLVSKNSEYLHMGYQRSSWSSWDSHGSESPILTPLTSPVYQQPSGHNPISSSQTGPYNQYLDFSVTDLIYAKGSTQEGDENIDDLKRRLEATTMEIEYLEKKIKHMEEKNALAGNINAEFSENGDSSS